MADIKEFINAKAALTPGIAGSLVLLLTNAIHTNFVPPAKQGWTALVLSLLLALLVVADLTEPYWKKMVYLLLNTLVIFAIAMGTNSTLAGERGPAVKENLPKERAESRADRILPALPGSVTLTLTAGVAEAQESKVTSDDEAKQVEELKRKEQLLQRELERKEEELEKTRKALNELKPLQRTWRRFFQPWSF